MHLATAFGIPSFTVLLFNVLEWFNALCIALVTYRLLHVGLLQCCPDFLISVVVKRVKVVPMSN